MSTSDEKFVTPTFRDLMRQFSPPWLRTGNAEKYLYAPGYVVDTLGDALLAGVKMRFPGYYSMSSLSVIGRERVIARGLIEDDATYAARLVRWLDDHSTRGGPYALLEQLYAYFAPNNFPITLVYQNHRAFTMDADGVITMGTSPFAPDTNSARWARWSLIYETDAFTPATPAVIESLRLVPAAWNAGHCQGNIYVLGTGAELWDWPTDHVWDESGVWDTADPTSIPIT